MLTYQLTAIVLVATVLAVWDGLMARSFALGCFVYVLPNTYFVYYAFRFYGGRQIQVVAQSFMRGESGKIVLAMLGFAALYRFVDTLHHPSVFFGFCSMIILQWYMSARVVRRLEQRASSQ